MEKLRYQKINNFLKTLNNREQKYILKKIQFNMFEANTLSKDFTILVNGKKI